MWRVACVACGADKNQAKIDASVLQARAPLGLVFNTKGSVVVAASAIRAVQSSPVQSMYWRPGREWSRERASERAFRGPAVLKRQISFDFGQKTPFIPLFPLDFDAIGRLLKC